MNLYDYQERLVHDLAVSISKGNKKIICQSATGSGKTVIFSTIVKRYTEKKDVRVLILVHRKELRKQTVSTLKKSYDIDAFEILPGSRFLPKKKIYIGLIQTVRNRLEKLKNIDMIIIDEAHLGNFKKIHENITGDQIIIGFSATPVSSSRKHPLKELYSSIICGPQISALIANGQLSQNYTYAPEIGIDRSKLKKNNQGDYRELEMAEQFKKQKNIQTTINAYEKHAKGEKTIIFNVNIDHSLKVVEAFTYAGYNIMHVDGKTKKGERNIIFDWFKKTPDAILCNVGIATMGFDEPSIQTVIVNRSTTSHTLWLQMAGRGSRITENKNTFKIIDLGENAENLGDWNSKFDWEYAFNHPKGPKDGGVAPVKSCPKCDAIIAARAMKCECGYEFPKIEEEDEVEMVMDDFRMITKNIIVQKEINFSKDRGYKEYSSYFNILEKLAKGIDKEKFNSDIKTFIFSEVHKKSKEWHNQFGRHYTDNRKKFSEERFTEILNKNKIQL